jgi:predicted metal-dependent RNase
MNAAANEEPVDPSDELMFLALGGGNEVGRSCHIIQYKGKTVMVSAAAFGVLKTMADRSCVARRWSTSRIRWSRRVALL